MRKALLIHVLLPAALLSGANAATLRPMVTLDAPVVRLSDLFDDAGPGAGKVLGPGPAPGGRIVVEAPQLAAIARQFGVDWHPASPADRAVLDRPGRPLPREDVLAALRPALAGAGATGEFDVDLPGFSPPLVAAETPSQCSVEQLDYDAATGRFTAMLGVSSEGMPVMHLRLAGRAQETLELPVPTRRLLAGDVLRPGDLQMARVRAGLVQTEMVRLPSQAIGMALRHTASPGQPLALADLGRPTLVQKGARVMMALDTGGLAVAAAGEAMEPGGLGEQIAVLNPNSRAVVMAEVTGPGAVRVSPGTLPTTPAQRLAASQVAFR